MEEVFYKIEAADNLLKVWDSYQAHTASTQDVIDCIIALCDYGIQYVNTEIKSSTFDYAQVANEVFITKFKNEGQAKSYYRSMLRISKMYFEELKKSISVYNVAHYDTLILTIYSDTYELHYWYEVLCKNKESLRLGCGARRNLCTMDIRSAIGGMLFFEDNTELTKIPYREIRPYTIFMVRQCLEIAGKRLIGFVDIKDQNNKSIPKFTQIAWEYLIEAEKKGYVSLPFKASAIHNFNAWTNQFVHTTFFSTIFIQFYAAEFLFAIMEPAKHGIMIYTGKTPQSFDYGDFQLFRYDEMKRDFENYISQKHNKPFSVSWLDYESVGGYIISLGNLEQQSFISLFCDKIKRIFKCQY